MIASPPDTPIPIVTTEKQHQDFNNYINEAIPTNCTTTTTTPQTQTIAVVGSGAVGCFYGMRLCEVGHNVTFFMRDAQYQTSRTQGLTLTSINGNVHIPAQALQAVCNDIDASTSHNAIIRSTSQTFDWVLLALKSSSLADIPRLVAPLLDPNRTRMLVIMNGLIEEDLIRLLKMEMNEAVNEEEPLRCCQCLYGGMAFLCSNRATPCWINHSYAGQLSVGVASTQQQPPMSISASDHSPSSVVIDDIDRKAIEDLWKGVKVPLAYEDNLLFGRWKKNVWNLAFNGLSTAMGGWTTDRIVQDPSLRQLANAIMDETIQVGNADLASRVDRRHSTRSSSSQHLLGPEFKALMFNLTDQMGPYKTSTMLDLTNRRPMEVKYLFQEPVKRARALRVPVPHLETVVAQIEALQRLYGL